MLNGLGLQKLTFKGNVYASICCIGTILFLVPRYGIIGFVIALLVQSGFVTIYHLTHVLSHISLKVDVLSWIVRPAIAAIAGCLVMKYLHTFVLVPMFSLTLSTIIAVLALRIFYVAFLFIFQSLTFDYLRIFLH